MAKRKRHKKRGRKVIRIFPDSSWIISLLNEKDVHHNHVKSCFGMLIPQKLKFYLSTLVMMETMSGLVRKGFTVKNAQDAVAKKFISKLPDDYMTETPIALNKALDKYAMFAKTRKLKNLTTVDFYIATEALLQKAKLLTSDIKMYKAVKQGYQEVYFMSDRVKSIPSDLPRLTKDVVYNLKY